MLTELSREQERLLIEVENEWLSYLLERQSVDRSAIEAELHRFCDKFQVKPKKILLADGPLEAQHTFLERLMETDSPSNESALQYQISTKVWRPVVREVRAKVSPHLCHHIQTQLGRAFLRIMGELEQFLFSNLMSRSLGSGLATDVYACALVDFFTRIGVVANDCFETWRKSLAEGLWGSISQGGVFIGVLSPKQGQIIREQQGEFSLHSTTTSALRWNDGTRSYWIRGTPVCKELFEEPQMVPLELFFREWDSLTKQQMISVLGVPRFLEKTRVRVLDSDTDRSGMPRRLLRVQVSPWDHWCLVEVKCPSKGDLHYLWVPPDMERCSQAVAWTFGFEVEEYQPLIEA